MPTLPVHEWIEALKGLYDAYGYLIVFLGTFGENTALLGLLLPGNSLALLGAFYARVGTLNLGWVIFFAWLGTILGYSVDYLLGRFVLGRITGRLNTSPLGKRLRLAGRIRLARLFLHRHGGKAILLSHAVGHIRSFVAISAGLAKMNYPRFLCFEMIAALLWNTAFSLLGYMIAVEIDRLSMFIGQAGSVVLIVLVLLFLAWSWWKRKQKQEKALQRRRRKSGYRQHTAAFEKHTPGLS